jgi:AmmeMemoRadiSam system protein A
VTDPDAVPVDADTDLEPAPGETGPHIDVEPVPVDADTDLEPAPVDPDASIDELVGAHQRELLDLGLAAVREELRTGQRLVLAVADLPPWLGRRGASFVTLEGRPGLLGCIGSVEPRRSLALDVVANARAAAFEDPRLPPVTAGDWPDLTVKVSVLSELEPMPAGSFDDVLAWIRPGVDGVLLATPGHRGTFLPSVWEKLPDTEAFLHQLLAKAGLTRSVWPPDAKAWRYTTAECVDPAPRPPL